MALQIVLSSVSLVFQVMVGGSESLCVFNQFEVCQAPYGIQSIQPFWKRGYGLQSLIGFGRKQPAACLTTHGELGHYICHAMRLVDKYRGSYIVVDRTMGGIPFTCRLCWVFWVIVFQVVVWCTESFCVLGQFQGCQFPCRNINCMPAISESYGPSILTEPGQDGWCVVCHAPTLVH